jgi:hypothetical protein
MQLRAAWQAQQVHATRRDIFSDCPRSELETSRIEFIKQFFMEQVYLPQIWLRRVFGNTGSVLDSSSQMSITIHAQTGQERDAIVDWLGELMHLAAAHCDHRPIRNAVHHAAFSNGSARAHRATPARAYFELSAVGKT